MHTPTTVGQPAANLRTEAAAVALAAILFLNEGQAAKFFGVGRRTFHKIRQEPWFAEKCTAIEFQPRSLRFARAELEAAAMNAPRRVVQAEPQQLLRQRIERMKAGA